MHNEDWFEIIYKECPICGKVFVSKRKYCSDLCSKIGYIRLRASHVKYPTRLYTKGNHLGKEYRKFIAHIKAKNKGLCQICGMPGACVHHILHVSKYPKLEMIESNVMYLCTLCHSKQHPELPYKFFINNRFYYRTSKTNKNVLSKLVFLIQ